MAFRRIRNISVYKVPIEDTKTWQILKPNLKLQMVLIMAPRLLKSREVKGLDREYSAAYTYVVEIVCWYCV